MTSADIKRKELIKRIREEIKLISGENPSDQDILENSLKFVESHVSDFVQEFQISMTKKPLYDIATGILEDEYNVIKSSGKSVKDVIRDSWRF